MFSATAKPDSALPSASLAALTNRQFSCALLLHVIVAAWLIFLGRQSDIDLRLADWMYDFSKGEFGLRGNWFAAVLMHAWMKIVLIGFGLLVIASLAVDRVFSLRSFEPLMRWRLKLVAASFMVVPLSATLMKSQSIHSCPWSMERYGGVAPYLRIFDALPPGVPPGHCFPAGHASSGLWLAAFAVFWLPQRPRIAAVGFMVGLVPGLALGWIQQLRGAHFLTHTLWSVWIASILMLLLVRVICPPPPIRDTRASSASRRQDFRLYDPSR